MNINSGAIAIADHGGHFGFEHHDFVTEALNEKYFKIGNIYQNNYPIGLFNFHYGEKASLLLHFNHQKFTIKKS